MKASLIGAEAELQTRRRFILLSCKPLQLTPSGSLKIVAIVQQHATQEPPRRRPRLQRRAQAAKLALPGTTGTSHDNRRPPPDKRDRTAESGGGQSWESGFCVGKAVTVHSTTKF